MTTIDHEQNLRDRILAEESASWHTIQNRLMKTMQSLYKQFDLKVTRLRANKTALDRSFAVDRELDRHIQWVAGTELEQQLEKMRKNIRQHSINDKIVADHRSASTKKRTDTLCNEEDKKRQLLGIEEAEAFQVICIAFVGGRGGLNALRRQQLRVHTFQLNNNHNDDDDQRNGNEGANERTNDNNNFERTSSKPTSAGPNKNNDRQNKKLFEIRQNASTPTPASASSNNFENRKNSQLALTTTKTKSPAAGSGINLLRQHKKKTDASSLSGDQEEHGKDDDNEAGNNRKNNYSSRNAALDVGVHVLSPDERLKILHRNAFFLQNPEVERSLHHDLRSHRQEDQRQINKQKYQQEARAIDRERIEHERKIQQRKMEEKQLEARKKTVMSAALARAYSAKSKAIVRQEINDELLLLLNQSNNKNRSVQRNNNNNIDATDTEFQSSLEASFNNNNNNPHSFLSESRNTASDLKSNEIDAFYSEERKQEEHGNNNNNNDDNNYLLKSPLLPSPIQARLQQPPQQQQQQKQNTSPTITNQRNTKNSSGLVMESASYIMSQSLKGHEMFQKKNNSYYARNFNKNNLQQQQQQEGDEDIDEFNNNNDDPTALSLFQGTALSLFQNNNNAKSTIRASSSFSASQKQQPNIQGGNNNKMTENVITVRGENLGKSLAGYHQERRDMLEAIACVDTEKLNQFEKSRSAFATNWMETRETEGLVALTATLSEFNEVPFLNNPTNNSDFSFTSSNASKTSNNNNNLAGSNATIVVAKLAVSISKCPVLTHVMKDRLRKVLTVNHGPLYRGYPFEGPIVVDDDYIEPVSDMLGRKQAEKKRNLSKAQEKLELRKMAQSNTSASSFEKNHQTSGVLHSSGEAGQNKSGAHLYASEKRRKSLVADVDEKDEEEIKKQKEILQQQHQAASEGNSKTKNVVASPSSQNNNKQTPEKEKPITTVEDINEINDIHNAQPLARSIRFCSRILQLRKHINCLDLRSIKHPLNEVAMTEVVALLAMCPQVIRVLWPKEAPPVDPLTVETALRLLNENTAYLQRVFALCDVKNALVKLPQIEASEAATLPIVRKIAHAGWELLRSFFDQGHKLLRQHIMLCQKESVARLKVLADASLVEAEIKINRRRRNEQELIEFGREETNRREAVFGIEDRARRVTYRAAYDESTEIDVRDQQRERAQHEERKRQDKERFEEMNAIRREEMVEHHKLIEYFMKAMRILEKKDLDRLRALEAQAEAEAREEKLKQMEEARKRREEQMVEINRQSLLRTAATQRQIFESDERRNRDRITGAEKKDCDNNLQGAFTELLEMQHKWDRHRERMRLLNAMRESPLVCRFVVPIDGEDDNNNNEPSSISAFARSSGENNNKRITSQNSRAPHEQVHLLKQQQQQQQIQRSSVSPSSPHVNIINNNNNSIDLIGQQNNSESSLSSTINNIVGTPVTASSNPNVQLQQLQQQQPQINNINPSTLRFITYDTILPRHMILESRLPTPIINTHSNLQRVWPHQTLFRALDIVVESPNPVFSWQSAPGNSESRNKHIERAKSLLIREAAQRGLRRLPSMIMPVGDNTNGLNVSTENSSAQAAVAKKTAPTVAHKHKDHHHHKASSNAATTTTSHVPPTSKKEQELIQQELELQKKVLSSFDKEGEEVINVWKERKEKITEIEVSYMTPQNSLMACCWMDPSSIAPRWQPKPDEDAKKKKKLNSAKSGPGSASDAMAMTMVTIGNNELLDTSETQKFESDLIDPSTIAAADDNYAAELDVLAASISPAPIAVDYIDPQTGFVHFLLFDCHGEFFGSPNPEESPEEVRPPLKSSHPHCNRVIASMVLEPLFAENFFVFDPSDDEETQEEKRGHYLTLLQGMLTPFSPLDKSGENDDDELHITHPSVVPLSHFARKITINCPPKFSQTYKNGAETADDVSLASDLDGKIFTPQESSKILRWIAERIGTVKMQAPAPEKLLKMEQQQQQQQNRKTEQERMQLSGSPQHFPISFNHNNNGSIRSRGNSPPNNNNNTTALTSPELSPRESFVTATAMVSPLKKFENIFSKDPDLNFGSFVVRLQSVPAPPIEETDLDPISTILGLKKKEHARPLTKLCPALHFVGTESPKMIQDEIDEEMEETTSNANPLAHLLNRGKSTPAASSSTPTNNKADRKQSITPASFFGASFSSELVAEQDSKYPGISLVQTCFHEQEAERIHKKEEAERIAAEEEKERQEREAKYNKMLKPTIQSCYKTKLAFEVSSILGQMLKKEMETKMMFESVSFRFREGTDDVCLFPYASVPVPFFAKLKEKGGGNALTASLAMLSSPAAASIRNVLGANPASPVAASSANNQASTATATTASTSKEALPSASMALIIEICGTRSAFFDPADCIWFRDLGIANAGAIHDKILANMHPDDPMTRPQPLSIFNVNKNAFGQTQILRNGRPILFWIEGDILRSSGEEIEFNEDEHILPPIEALANRVVLRLAPDVAPEAIEDFLRSLVFRNASRNIVVGKRFISATLVLYTGVEAHMQDRIVQDADAIAKQITFLSVIETEAIDDPTDIDFNWPGVVGSHKKCIMNLPQPNMLVPQPSPPFLVCFNATVDDPDTPQFENFALAGSLLQILPNGQPHPYRLNSITRYDKIAQTFRYQLSLATAEEMKSWCPLVNEALPGSLEPATIQGHQPSFTQKPPLRVIVMPHHVNSNNKTPALSRRNSMAVLPHAGGSTTPVGNKNNHTFPQTQLKKTVSSVSNTSAGKGKLFIMEGDESVDSDEMLEADPIEIRNENQLFIGEKLSGTFTFDAEKLSFRYDIVDCTLEELDMLVKRVCIRAYPVLHPKTEGGPREALKKPPLTKSDDIVNYQRQLQKLPSSHFLNHNYILAGAHNQMRLAPMLLQLHLRLIPPKNLPRTPPTLVHQDIQVFPPLVVPSASTMIQKYREQQGKKQLALFEVGPGEKVTNNVVSLSESDGWEQGCVMFRIASDNVNHEDFLTFEPDKDTKLVKVSELLDDVALIGGIKGLTVPSAAELKKKKEQDLKEKQEKEKLLQEQQEAQRQLLLEAGATNTGNAMIRPSSSSPGFPGGGGTKSLHSKPSSADPNTKKPAEPSSPTAATTKPKEEAPAPSPKKAPTASEVSRAKASSALLQSACKNPGWRHVVKSAYQYETYFVVSGVRHDIFALIERISQTQLMITFRSTQGDFNSFVRRNEVANMLRKVYYENIGDNPDVDHPKIVEILSTTNNFVHVSRSYVTMLLQGVDDATDLFRASVPRELNDKQHLYPRIIRCEGAEDRRGFCPLDDLELDDPDTACFNDFIITIQISNPLPNNNNNSTSTIGNSGQQQANNNSTSAGSQSMIHLNEKIDFLSIAAQRVLNEAPINAPQSSSTSANTSARTASVMDESEYIYRTTKVVYALRQVTPAPQIRPQDGAVVLCLTANDHPIAMGYLSTTQSPNNNATGYITTLTLVSFKLDEDKYGEIRSHEAATTAWDHDVMNLDLFNFEETFPVLNLPTVLPDAKPKDDGADAKKGGKKPPAKPGAAGKKSAVPPPTTAATTATPAANAIGSNNNNNNTSTALGAEIGDADDGTGGGAGKKKGITLAQNIGLLIPMSALQDLLRRIVITVDGAKVPSEGIVKQMTCKIKSREGAEGKLSFPLTFLPPCFSCPPGSVENELILPKLVPPLLLGSATAQQHQLGTESGATIQTLKNVSMSISPLFGRSCSVLLQPPDLIAAMRRSAMLKDEASFVHFQCILNPRVSVKKRLSVMTKEKNDGDAVASQTESKTINDTKAKSRVSLQLHPGLLSHPTIQLKLIPYNHEEDGDNNEKNKKFTHRIVPLLFGEGSSNNNNSSEQQDLKKETIFFVSQTFGGVDNMEGSSQLQVYAADENHASSSKLSDVLRCITVVRIDQQPLLNDENSTNKNNNDDAENPPETESASPLFVDFDQIDHSLNSVMVSENIKKLKEENGGSGGGDYKSVSDVEGFVLNPTVAGFPQQNNVVNANAPSHSSSLVAISHAVTAVAKLSKGFAATSALVQQQQSQQPRLDQNLYFCHCKLVTYEDHDLAIRSFIVHA